MRFIKLKEPCLRNLPTQQEGMRFEEYMHENITERNKSGLFFNGKKYFKDKTVEEKEDDLAYVLEDALVEWSDNHKYTAMDNVDSYMLIYDKMGNVYTKVYNCDEDYTWDQRLKTIEEELHQDMAKVIKEHLKRTSGKVGHFPYTGKRTMLTCTDELNNVFTITFDPTNIYPEIDIDPLYKTAEANNPEHKAESKKQRETVAKKELKKQLTVFISSVAALFLSYLLKTISGKFFENESFLYLVLLTLIITVAIPVAVISLRAFFNKKKDLKDIQNEDINRFDAQSFPGTNFEKKFIYGVYYKVYNEHNFKSDFIMLYKYLRYMQLWHDSAGVEHNYQTCINELYEVVEPFITNKKDFEK